jgi:sigma-B regulation protein RsbU (phosphoserine phosphatase)
VTDLDSLLVAFRAASKCEASVWIRVGASVERIGASDKSPAPARLPSAAEGPVTQDLPAGPTIVGLIPGPKPAWLRVGPGPADALAPQFEFLLPVVGQRIQSALEVEHAAGELADRYEEINLLYTISEILGRTVNLEDATSRILGEISDTVGARRAAVQVHDTPTKSLIAVAALGAAPSAVPRIHVDDAESVTARVFRTCHATIVNPAEPGSPAEDAFRRGTMLSVPIMWTAPNAQAEPLGVVSLSDRRSGQPFTAGDQKLISAIATQIGTAIQNARLVSESLHQERLKQEMQLAHDLQMRLLPDASSVAPNAVVAARVVPAESVGGDLYNLFRLGQGKTGVMVGDVSGHGYQAALVMALAMSASAIHAQTTTDPGHTLGALAASLHGELASSEMFVSMFYGVVDREAGKLRYANAGHPHAFVVSKSGAIERLQANGPPLGLGVSALAAAARRWSDDDLLLLFTDGVSDARDADGNRLGEDRMLEVAKKCRSESPARILDRMFELLAEHTAGARQRDDLTIVVLRS